MCSVVEIECKTEEKDSKDSSFAGLDEAGIFFYREPED